MSLRSERVISFTGMSDQFGRNTHLPERGLWRSQVGTVVEELAPGVFDVEFSDEHGRAYAMAALSAEHMMVLHDEPLDRAS